MKTSESGVILFVRFFSLHRAALVVTRVAAQSPFTGSTIRKCVGVLEGKSSQSFGRAAAQGGCAAEEDPGVVTDKLTQRQSAT